MNFLTHLLGSTIQYIIFIGVAVGGISLGKFLRDQKDASKAN